MRRLFLQFCRYLQFKKIRKDNNISTLFPRNHGLPVGSEFPDLTDEFKRIELTEFDGTIILFLSTTCQACIEIFTEINLLEEKWPNKGIIIFINGDDKEFTKIYKENQKELPIIQYEGVQYEIYKTTIFPFTYFLSNQGIILAQGAVNGVEQIDMIVNRGKEIMQYIKTGEISYDCGS